MQETIGQKEQWLVPVELKEVCRWFLYDSGAFIAELKTHSPANQIAFVRHELEQHGIDADMAFEELKVGRGEL